MGRRLNRHLCMAPQCSLEETSVVNAPTRRPPAYSARRRPPKGRHPVAGSIRDRLTTASALLRETGEAASAQADRLHEAGDAASAEVARRRAESAYDSAAAVDSILAPRGSYLLRKEEQRTAASPFTVTMTEDLKRALMVAGAEFGVVYSGLAEEAYRAVRDGKWVPPKPVKTPRGTGGAKAVLNVRVDAGLRRTVQEMLPALSEDAGYRMTEGNLVVSYMCDELGIERPDAGDAEYLRLVLRKPLVDYLQKRVEAEGLTFQKVLEDGLADLADGEVLALNQWAVDIESRPRDGGQWAPIQPTNPISMIERAKLHLKLSPDLLDRIRHRAGIESSRHGLLVHPGMVARAILTSRLGEPEELSQPF